MYVPRGIGWVDWQWIVRQDWYWIGRGFANESNIVVILEDWSWIFLDGWIHQTLTYDWQISLKLTDR